MNQCSLVEITTNDGIMHQGVYVKPLKASKKAILYIHGLTSAFYHGMALQNAVVDACIKKGIGYASFNNRGHDFITSGHVIDAYNEKEKSHITLGAGVEDFTKSIFDIDAGIRFLKQKGYTSIYLLGHSTGANKACYYGGTVKDDRVKGVMLASPISDRLNPTIRYVFIKRIFLKLLIGLGFGDTVWTYLNFFPITPKRALSLLEPGSCEDVFSYSGKNPSMEVYGNITTPVFILFGEEDEYRDRPIFEIKKVFDALQNAKKYKSISISNSPHGFDGKEKEFASQVVSWVSGL